MNWQFLLEDSITYTWNFQKIHKEPFMLQNHTIFSTIKHMTNFTWTGQSTQIAGNSYQHNYGDQALAITLTLNPNLTITHYHSTDPNPNPNPNLKITLTVTQTRKLTLKPWKKISCYRPSTPLEHRQTGTCTFSPTPSTESCSIFLLLV